MKRILFVCTGNICRSPLAEALLKRALHERAVEDVSVESAGTGAWDGAPASDGALLVGMERNMDLSNHRAQSLTRELVRENDIILAMGPHHLERIEALGGAGKAYLLADFASHGKSVRPISDPIGYKRRQSRDNGTWIGEPILQYRLTSTFGSQAGCHLKHKEAHKVLQIKTIGKVAGNLLHLVRAGASEPKDEVWPSHPHHYQVKTGFAPDLSRRGKAQHGEGVVDQEPLQQQSGVDSTLCRKQNL